QRPADVCHRLVGRVANDLLDMGSDLGIPPVHCHCEARNIEDPVVKPGERLGHVTPNEQGVQGDARAQQVDPFGGVLLQSWAESSEDSVSHSLMAAACGRSQAVSKTRLTITASGFGCP